MNNTSFLVQCDGCGLPASAEHVRVRVERLEMVTRFRPIHIQVLFIASDPPPKWDDDFYVNPAEQEFSRGLLEALQIPIRQEKWESGSGSASPGISAGNATLLEFQRRGYYLAYLSECPLGDEESASVRGKSGIIGDAIARLTPSLVTRIRFNYKPKQVVLIGRELHPLIGVLKQANLGQLLVLDNGLPFELPRSGDAATLRSLRHVLVPEIPGLKSVSSV